MIQILKIIDSEMDIFYLDYWNKCYLNSKNINDIIFNKYNFESWSEVYNYYSDYPYIVMYDNIPIGFFFNDLDNNSNAIGLSVYMTEESDFKLSLIIMNTLILCGILSNYKTYKDKNIRYLEFNTFSNYIVKYVKNIIPNINIVKIRKEYILMYGEIINLNLSFVEELFNKDIKNNEEYYLAFDIPEEIIINNKIIKIFGRNYL